MALDAKDKLFLMALKADPFMSMNELADKLGVAWITAKRHYNKLKSTGIIKNPVAIFRPEPLGLERVNVIVETPNFFSLRAVEKSCTEHPYTHYRVRAFGKVFALFIQFDIPEGTDGNLKEFLKELRGSGYINHFEILKSQGIRFESFPNLKKFNAKTSKWDFSWEEWLNNLSNHSTKIPDPFKINTDFSQFTESHFRILRKITANATITQKEIKEELNLSRTETYRQYHYVLDNYIDTVRLIYDRKVFNLTETFLTVGKVEEKAKLGQFFNAIKEDSPPFHLALDLVEQDKFVFWSNMDSDQANSFNFSLWKIFPDMNTFMLDTTQSSIYWFYPPNFDFEKRKWRSSKKYMIEEPLLRLEQNLENR